MKRTKDNWLSGPRIKSEGISGLIYFEGEDLQYLERKKAIQEAQRKWIEESLQFKSAKKLRERVEEKAWDSQMVQRNRIKGILEEKHKQLVRIKHNEYKRANIEISRLKKLRDQEERMKRIKEDKDARMRYAAIRALPPYINPFKS